MNLSKHLTIYFTSDTHGYLYNTNFASREPLPMGLLGFTFPKDGNTLVIDGGDTIQGSPLTDYCHENGVPLPITGVMNRLGYDYVTLGNHDFNYGPDWLRPHLQGLRAKCLCANVAEEGLDLPILPYAVHVLENGLRVGLVGLVTQWVNRWEKPENLRGLTITEPVEPARRAVEQLRAQGVDLVIGIYHGGIERDLATGRSLSATDENLACRLCEEVPFDLLLTGHQHIAMAEKQWHGVHLAQTPCNATQCVRVDIDVDGGRKEIHSALLPARADGAEAPELSALRRRLEAWLDEPVGRLSCDLWPADKLDMALHGSSIADFFNMVQLWATGAEVSCAALPNELRGLAKEVTVRDVVASYIYSNTLVTLRVTGAVLRQALEQCARYFAVGPDGRVSISSPFLEPKEAHYNYDYFAGIEYTFDLRRPEGQRVTALTRNGVPVLDTDSLTLVMCNYRATGAGDFDMYLGCERVQEGQAEVSQLILDYVRAHPMVEIPEKHPCTVIVP